MTQKIDLYDLCNSNGFFLKEYPLEGRLLAVLLKSKIIIKDSLSEERKQTLVKKVVSYLLVSSDCQRAIFWEGERQFFRL